MRSERIDRNAGVVARGFLNSRAYQCCAKNKNGRGKQ